MTQVLTNLSRWFLCSCLLIVWLLPIAAGADEGYISLVGMPGLEGGGATDMSKFIETAMRMLIIAAALLAVVKIIMAGAQYVLSGIVTDKEHAKRDVRSALIGLLIILSAVVILRTINPGLTNLPALKPAGDLIPWEDIVPKEPEGEKIAKSDLYAEEGDIVHWVGTLFYIKDENDCINHYGVYIPPTALVGARCLIKKSARTADLPNLVSANCPSDRQCRAELCDESNLGIFESCESQCLSRNGIKYDSYINGCVFYDDNYELEQKDITVDPGTIYTMKQNPDEEAAGDPLKKIKIVGTSSVGGMVEVEFEDGTKAELSCSYINPSPCE